MPPFIGARSDLFERPEFEMCMLRSRRRIRQEGSRGRGIRREESYELVDAANAQRVKFDAHPMKMVERNVNIRFLTKFALSRVDLLSIPLFFELTARYPDRTIAVRRIAAACHQEA